MNCFSVPTKFFVAMVIGGFAVVSVFGAVAMKQNDPRVQLTKEIAQSIKQSVESPIVQLKIDEFMVALVKQAQFTEKERKALLRIVSALKIYQDQRWLFDMLQVGSDRDIQKVADALGMKPADIKEYDEKEQGLTESLRDGELDVASYDLMIKQMDKEPRYAPIKAIHKGVSDATLLLKALDAEMPGNYVQKLMSKHLTDLINALK